MGIQKRLWIAMVVLGASSRLLPHPWNFTPLMALGLFAGNKAQKTSTGVFVTLAALALSDTVMGFYSGFWYIYAAALLPVLLGRVVRNRGVGAIAGAAVASSVSFFLTTNFMVWATTQLYPHTSAGLMACYAAGLPFYQNQALGDAFYAIGIFGGYAVISQVVRQRHQAA
jgi:hypothetical protein